MPRAVLDALGAAPGESVMVGDNANDVAVAHALNMPIILRADGYTPTPAAELGADAIINHFAELPEALMRFS